MFTTPFIVLLRVPSGRWGFAGMLPEALAGKSFATFDEAWSACIGYQRVHGVRISMLPSEAQHEECPDCGHRMAYHLADGPRNRSADLVPCQDAQVNFQVAVSE